MNVCVVAESWFFSIDTQRAGTADEEGAARGPAVPQVEQDVPGTRARPPGAIRLVRRARARLRGEASSRSRTSAPLPTSPSCSSTRTWLDAFYAWVRPARGPAG